MNTRSEEKEGSTALVAVVTRTKDRPLLLRRAIDSVLNQTFSDWLHVIVNDGGNQAELNALLAEYEAAYQGRLLLIHNPVSIGMQAASNLAIQSSASEYLIIHDDDDSWAPGFLAAAVPRLEALGGSSPVQGVVVYTTWIFEEIEAGSVVEKWRQPFPIPSCIRLMDLAGENRFPPIAFLYRRRVHDQIGLFDPEFTVMGDWDFNIRFFSLYEVEVIPEPLANYHWRHKSKGTAYGNSVTDGLDEHKSMAVRLHNTYLRRELETGRPGIGHLMNISHMLVQLSGQVESLQKRAGIDALLKPLNESFLQALKPLNESFLQALKPLNETFLTVEQDHARLAEQAQDMSNRLAELQVRVDQTAGAASAALAQAEHISRITRDLARFWEIKDWIRRSIDIMCGRRRLHLTRQQVFPREDPRETVMAFVGALKAGDVLSLDVFDTALLRKLWQPTDVFLLMEPDVRRLLRQPDLEFAAGRMAAELAARQRFCNRGCEDITLAQIYLVWAELNEVDASDAARVRALEMDTEQRICYGNPVIREAVESARMQGARVIFMSDMYLPAEVITGLLNNNGYDAADVFVSGDHGKTKHSGRLFDYVLKQLDVVPSRVFHIGDNEASDQHRPRELGIHTLHLDRSVWGWNTLIDEHSGITGRGVGDALSSLMTGLVRKRVLEEGKPAVWDRLGFEVTGPVMYGFVRWIAQQAVKDGVKHLFFLSRDGYYLEKAFRFCSLHWGLGIESTYMYASRRLLNLARITRMDEAALDFLLSSNPLLTVRDMLERIGLPADALAGEVAKAGLSGVDETLTTTGGVYCSPETRAKAARLLRALGPRILEIAAAERRKVLAYFEDIHFRPDEIAIVDVGWQASSIRSLQDLLREQQPDYFLRGYYFGTWCFAQPSVEAGCRIDSFYIHLHEPGHRAALIAECVEMVEHLFSAPHPTVVSLERTQKGWEPVFGTWETSAEQRVNLEQMSHQALLFVHSMLELEPVPCAYGPPDDYMDGVLERILRYPSVKEAGILGALPHRDSFGGTAPWRHLANIPSPSMPIFHSRRFREAYARSYWKRGFLIQVSPAERQLLGAG